MKTDYETIFQLDHLKDFATDTQKKALDKAIEALEANRWIPVSERLPDKNKEYLVKWTTSQSEEPFNEIGEYDHKEREWLLPYYVWRYPDVEVIAWKNEELSTIRVQDLLCKE